MANLKLVTIVTIVILSFILFIFPAPDGTIYTVFRIFAFISITFLFFQSSIKVQKSEAPSTKSKNIFGSLFLASFRATSRL